MGLDFSWNLKITRARPDEIRLPGATRALNKVESLNEAKARNVSEAGEIPYSQLRHVEQ